MTLIDSVASFEKRCADIDQSGTLLDGLKNQGVTCFSALAFTIGTPQTAPTDRQYEELAAKVFGGEVTLGQTSSLRRLHFEATTLIVATLNEQVKSDSSDPGSLVKKLPAAEKQARLERQQARLSGLKLVGELAPSHQLLDLVNSILESGAIVWVAPSRCSKRDDEIHANIKPHAATVQVENSTLKLAQVPVTTSADVGTELKLCWALQRRGLAFDSCRLLDWHIHEAWVQYLMGAMARDYPAGYSSVRSEQIIKADRELWTILAQEHKETLRPSNDIPALNKGFTALTTDPRVTMYLLPVPVSATKGTNVPAPSKVTPAPKGTPSPGVGINKKRKLTRAQKGCPQELKDYDLKVNQGAISGPVCWGYNLKNGCPNDTTTQNGCSRCKRGYHVCANCHKPGHSLVTCRAVKTKA